MSTRAIVMFNVCQPFKSVNFNAVTVKYSDHQGTTSVFTPIVLQTDPGLEIGLKPTFYRTPTS